MVIKREYEIRGKVLHGRPPMLTRDLLNFLFNIYPYELVI